MRRSILIAAAVLGSVSTQSYAAEEKQVRIPGIYTNMAYIEDAGDLVGTEIFIISTGDGYVAFFQCWTGSSTHPVTFPVEVAGETISFTVPEDSSCKEGDYKGRISKSGFDGTWTHKMLDGSSKKDPVHLKRGKSYFQSKSDWK